MRATTAPSKLEGPRASAAPRARSEDDKVNELLVRCWRDAETRKRFIAEPMRVLREEGIDLPPGIDVVVVEDTATKVHVVLPPPAAMHAGALTDDQLDAISGGTGTAAGGQPVATPTNPTLAKPRNAQPITATVHTCDKVCSALSQRRHKKDIGCLSQDDERRLADELMSFRLARYDYTNESAPDPRHLGFIIDDVAPSAAIAKDGEQVGLYGYASMAVAALQVQQKQIDALEKQVAELKSTLAAIQR